MKKRLVMRLEDFFARGKSFLPLSNDLVFKAFFRPPYEHLLASLISSMYEELKAHLPTNDPIVKLENLNPELIPECLVKHGGELAKVFILDVKTKNTRQAKDGTYYYEYANMEMQNYRDKNIYPRGLAYLTRTFSDQPKQGEDYEELLSVYSFIISSVNLGLFEDQENYIRAYTFMSYVIHHDPELGIRMIFIELLKFNKKIHELKTYADYWLYFLKNAFFVNLQESLIYVEKGGIMTEALERILDLSEDQKFQEYYKIRMKQQREQEKRVKVAREEGEARGEARGKAEGKAETQRRIARKLLTKGMKQHEVVQTTGLNKTEIAKLAARISSISSR